MEIEFNFGKKLLFIVSMFALPSVINSQVMWSIRGGIMPATVHEDMDYDEDATVNKTDWMAEFGLEIPVSKTWNIETALRYRMKSFVAYQDEHVEYRRWNKERTETYIYEEYDTRHYKSYLDASLIELPIRATYKLYLNNDISLHIGCGPYASINLTGKPFSAGQNFSSSALSIGIEPSATIYFKNFGIGVVYNNPVFFQKHKEKDSNRFMITLGFRFGNKVWNSIGKGIDTFVESGAADALGNALQNAANTMGNNVTVPAGTYSTSSNSSSSSSKSSSSTNGNKNNMGEQQSYNLDKSTYGRYDSMLSAHFYGGRSATGNEVKQWQQEMKRLREK